MSHGTQVVLFVATMILGPPVVCYGGWWILVGRKRASWEMPKWLQVSAIVLIYTLLFGAFIALMK